MYDGHVPAPNAAARSYAQLCGIATALDVIGDRWALLIVRDLMLGPLRFGDLADGLPGVGTNTLTARLKQLEAADVIERRLMPAPGRATVYQLTAYGHDLEPILLALGLLGYPQHGPTAWRARRPLALARRRHAGLSEPQPSRDESDRVGTAAHRWTVHRTGR